MSFDGSGTFTLTYNFNTEASSPPIAIAKLQTEFDGIATGLSNAILRDGTGKPTANIDWNSKKLTNLADATTDTDALNRQTGDARYPLKGSTSTISGAWTFSGTITLGAGIACADYTLTRPVLKDYGETRTAPTITANALTLDLEAGNCFAVALNANITTLTISNPSASGTACTFTLRLTADGTARTITWPASVKWASGAAYTPSSTNGYVDFLSFYTDDGGTTWFVSYAKAFR